MFALPLIYLNNWNWSDGKEGRQAGQVGRYIFFSAQSPFLLQGISHLVRDIDWHTHTYQLITVCCLLGSAPDYHPPPTHQQSEGRLTHQSSLWITLRAPLALDDDDDDVDALLFPCAKHPWPSSYCGDMANDCHSCSQAELIFYVSLQAVSLTYKFQSGCCCSDAITTVPR